MILPAEFILTARSTADTAPLQVVCAWPLSGQYGFGSRILFYLLICTCVFARKSLWLRNTFLAATLLFPVVAALHAIVLAAKHVDGAVDMDIYGAFQLCSLGLVAGTMAVRMSKTYYGTPGRNTIFLWVTLILAGLLSLIVEFYRATPTSCPRHSEFKYGENQCGMVCSEDDGPSSPLRQGAASDIYVVEAPSMLSFQAAILLSAGCCIHAVVWMLYMLEKIMREEERRKAEREESHFVTELSNQPSTLDLQDRAYGKTRVFIVVFGAVGLALLVVGEKNFHSPPLMFQIEPLSGVGQWSSIVTAVLAAAGSLLVPLHADMAKVRSDREEEKKKRNGNNEDEMPRKSRGKSSRSYNVARRFVDVEEWIDEGLKRLVGKSSRTTTGARYPTLPGEEYRDPRVSGLPAAEQGFVRSRSPSMTRQGYEGGPDRRDLESPALVHTRQDISGHLAVPENRTPSSVH